VSKIEDDRVEKLKEDNEETDEMVRNLGFWAKLKEYFKKLPGPRTHKVFGHPDPVQNEMQLECQLVSNGISMGDPDVFQNPRIKNLESGATDWRLLLQLDSDNTYEQEWYDSGMLYFWIHEKDLAKHDFNNVWMILQCS
jgi:uncharacterized protein YwqG